MSQQNKEAKINLALLAIQQDPKLSFRRAAQIYEVSHEQLSRRTRGILSRRDQPANSRKLTDLEEKTIIGYILDLDSQGFPPRLSGVEDMANRLLELRDGGRVGKNWPNNFVNRQPELKTRLNRKYDYQRAKCEDPELIRGWFELVKNTIAKYGIQVADIYNFDETGFLMGQISTTMVVTSAERRGRPKSKQPGNREWATVIQAVCATGWALPAFVVVKGQYHLRSWYDNEQLPKGWRVHTSETGWTTNAIGLDWITHFNQYTRPRTVGSYRLLILDGHESHHSVDFEIYCKENNIVTLCMPAHSSHILQPLDIGCFSPLKKAYGKQIEELMKGGQTHITKEDFLPALCAAFPESISESNIQGGFRGAGLIPFDPERVISTLDLQFRTPTPSNSRPGTSHTWVSKTPNNPTEASSQSTFLKNRISEHANSSPTQSFDAIEKLGKAAIGAMQELALLKTEIQLLRKRNKELSKRRRAKKTRLRNGGSLAVEEAQDLITEIDVGEQVKEENRGSSGRAPRTETRARRCGNCGETGHNARTCQIVTEFFEESESD
jgi:hypothetical protein